MSRCPTPPKMSVLTMHLAVIARVPQNERDEFHKRISSAILDIWQRDRRAMGTGPGRLLLATAKAARLLENNFLRLKTDDRDWLENFKQSQTQLLAGEIKDLRTTIQNLTTLLYEAVGRPSPVPRSRYFRNVSRTVQDQMLRVIVFRLLAAAADTGGQFTYNKNSDTGTLAQALRLLRTHLPSGLVSDPLPASTIQRLKTEYFQLTQA